MEASERHEQVKRQVPPDIIDKYGLDACALALGYIDHELGQCQSILVDMLMQRDDVDGFGYSDNDDLVNVYPDPDDWDEEDLHNWLVDHDLVAPVRDDDDVDEWLDELRQLVRDNEEAAEVYEWWLVTSWLAKELTSIGEVVLDNDYGTWWGRQATGQSIALDSTMYRIAQNHVARTK